jgi:RNA polymerase primary sigma factor
MLARNLTALDYYHKDLSYIKDISIEEERELNQKLIQARLDVKNAKSKLRKRKENRKNKQAVLEYKRAYQKLTQIENIYIERNLRLAYAKVKQMFPNLRLPLEDKIQFANVGLKKAIKKFDPRAGTRYSTYAIWYIKHSVIRGFQDTQQAIRIPVHALDRRTRLKKGNDNDLTDTEREELAHLEKIENVISLESFTKKTEQKTLNDALEDPQNISAEQMLIEKETKNALGELLGVLDEREKFVIEASFGIQQRDRHDEGMNMPEIGEVLKLTHQRISQIRQQSLLKLRKAALKKHLI